MPPQLTNVASDDALTTIYRLSHDEQETVIAARVAERLGVTAPSAAAMLSRLRRGGLVDVDAHKQIALTPTGFARAERMIRRHRLAECLLVQTLGLEWSRAYEEAHLMEHALSDVTEPLLFEHLDRPRRSPFGYPIPGNGEDHPSRRRLSDVPAGTHTVVERVYEENTELLRFFELEAIRPGASIEVIDLAPYRGTMTISLDGRELVLGLTAARHVWVSE